MGRTGSHRDVTRTVARSSARQRRSRFHHSKRSCGVLEKRVLLKKSTQSSSTACRLPLSIYTRLICAKRWQFWWQLEFRLGSPRFRLVRRAIARKDCKYGPFSLSCVFMRSGSRWPEWILSPPRMPFRHPGCAAANLSYQTSCCNMAAESLAVRTRHRKVLSTPGTAGINGTWPRQICARPRVLSNLRDLGPVFPSGILRRRPRLPDPPGCQPEFPSDAVTPHYRKRW